MRPRNDNTVHVGFLDNHDPQRRDACATSFEEAGAQVHKITTPSDWPRQVDLDVLFLDPPREGGRWWLAKCETVATYTAGDEYDRHNVKRPITDSEPITVREAKEVVEWLRAQKQGEPPPALPSLFSPQPTGTPHVELLAILLQGYLAVHDAVDRTHDARAAADRDWASDELRPALELMGWNESAQRIFDSTFDQDADAAARELNRRLEYLRGPEGWSALAPSARQKGLSVKALLEEEWRGLLGQHHAALPAAIGKVAELIENGATVAPPDLVVRCFLDVWPHLVRGG